MLTTGDKVSKNRQVYIMFYKHSYEATKSEIEGVIQLKPYHNKYRYDIISPFRLDKP